ncbi:MAG: rhomboid family intramembrane serine protease [Flavobacteriales bacterium]|jgi:membrane associated rhomboid family serine protease|nr:rhomboid family intramembrane serine protease [Flavobacteriales bacterium]
MADQQIRPGGFNILPPVVKNLLIINGLFYLATMALSRFGIDLVELLGLFIPQSEYFRPHQLVSYIFMHGSMNHIFFNMFALWMFGNAIENYWGGKRFLIYYMVTGLGAGFIHLGVMEFQLFSVLKDLSADQIAMVKEGGAAVLQAGQNYSDSSLAQLNLLLNTPTVGASGAVFGLLLAFGMMFPNAQIYLYFLFPIKAKYFVIGYGLIELFSGVSNRAGDNVAHFAHLGGMIFGFILIKYWQKKGSRF